MTTRVVVQQPFPQYSDVDGSPLESGYIYVGTSGLNAESSPVSVYWDEALSVPAAQPVRTVGGYPSNSGTPGRIFVAGDHSIIVKNKNSSLIVSSLTASSSPLITTPSFTTTIGVGGASAATSGAGITFPATASESSNANTLDDYDEGTWTPTDNSGAGLSFTIVFATYIKVGRFVNLYAKVTWPVTANAAQIQIAGVPFSAENTSVGVALADSSSPDFQTVFLIGTSINFTVVAGAVALNSAMSTKNLFLTISYIAA